MTEHKRQENAAPALQLGGALRGLQQRSGRTLRALEEQVCISDSSLSRYFRGDTVPPWPAVRDLCQALGADPSEYRALWEAADRGRPEPPPNVITASDISQPSALAWHRRVRAGFTGRWAFAAAGTVTGLLAGFLLASLVPNSSTARDTASDPRGVLAGEVSATTVKLSEEARIFVSRATGNCLDNSLDMGLRTYPCNGMSYQRWTVRFLSDGTRQLRSHSTGMCLADSSAGLRVLTCDDSHSQKWTLIAQEDEAVGLMNKTTENCLDDSGVGLRPLPCTTTANQKWA